MTGKIISIWAGVIAGALLGYFLITRTDVVNIGSKNLKVADVFKSPKKVVIGFLPFWLIDKAQPDYSKYINELSYFNLVIDSDGTIQKFTGPGESDPGWHALYSGKIDDYLSTAKNNGIKLSLTIFSGDDSKINSFLEDPVSSAKNLTDEISPIMSQYGFSDLNLDIEKVSDASPEARIKYSSFVENVRKNLDKNITVTVDLTPISFVKDTKLPDPDALGKIADRIILMDYDFHNQGSAVTGPVSPQTGAGIVSEFDTVSAVQAALTNVPASKLIMAIPLYGYTWETINPFPRAATIPASSYSISTRSIDELLSGCSTCSAEFDQTDSESHVTFRDTETGTFHQIFYPDKISTQIKVDFARSQNLRGIALWALGYESGTILEPLSSYGR